MSSTSIIAIFVASVAIFVIVMAIFTFSNYGNLYGYGYNRYGGMMGDLGGWSMFLKRISLL